MKKKILFFLFLLFFYQIDTVFATTYKNYTLWEEVYPQTSDRQIQEAILLQGHIVRFAEKINSESERIWITKNVYLGEVYLELFKMKEILAYISEKRVQTENIEIYMKEIVKNLKNLNNELKIYFEEKELDAYIMMKNEQKKFTLLSNKLALALDTFIKDLSLKLTKKESLTKKEKEIVRLLIKLNKETKKLKEFKNLSFNHSEKMKDYLATSIIEVRNIMKDLKSISN